MLPLILKAVYADETCGNHLNGLRTFYLHGALLKQTEGDVN